MLLMHFGFIIRIPYCLTSWDNNINFFYSPAQPHLWLHLSYEKRISVWASLNDNCTFLRVHPPPSCSLRLQRNLISCALLDCDALMVFQWKVKETVRTLALRLCNVLRTLSTLSTTIDWVRMEFWTGFCEQRWSNCVTDYISLCVTCVGSPPRLALVAFLQQDFFFSNLESHSQILDR